MGTNNQIYRICEAMEKRGITDPESQSGIDFCTGQCPYDCCIVFEDNSFNAKTASGRRKVAQILRNHKVSVDDIALLLKVGRETVRKYLKSK